MLTPRAWWLLGVSLLVLLLGLGIGSPALTLTPLTLILWFGGEWLAFAVRIPLAVRRLRVVREVRDGRGPVATLWAGRTFEVVARLEGDGPLRLPYAAVADRPPFAVDPLGDPPAADGPVGRGEALEVRYAIRCRGAGLARFEGLRVQIADFQGFFYHVEFVPGVVVYRVLPVLVEGGEPTPALKRDNQLPPPGIHRLRRPAPPASCSTSATTGPATPQKPSPGRCRPAATASSPRSSRARRRFAAPSSWTPPIPSACRWSTARRLGRLVEIAAAVLQANADVRDLTGLCLFDDHESKAIRPDRSPAHVTQVLQTLADAAALAPASARTDPDHLVPVAYAFAREVYPQRMRPAVNDVPFWQEWFDTSPGYSRRKDSVIQYLFRRKRDFYYRLSWKIPTALLLADAALLFFFVVYRLPILLVLLLLLVSAFTSALSFFGAPACSC